MFLYDARYRCGAESLLSEPETPPLARHLAGKLMARDDFSASAKQQLANRVNHRCSNPDCRATTSGPQLEPEGSINVGVAAHITAASAGGPRFDAALSFENRTSAANGIWLCQNCAKLVDNDALRFPADLLREWKARAEAEAFEQIGRTSPPAAKAAH